MNLYLLLAFAFGAVTAAADAPIARASVILSRADGEGSQAAKAEPLLLPLRLAQGSGQGDGAREPIAKRAEVPVPLTGASSPRAPATLG